MKAAERLWKTVKIFHHFKRKSLELPYGPLRMWVEATNRCNLRCTFCPNSTDRTSPRGDMDYNLFRHIMSQAAGSVNDVNISHRGESLFHPRLIDMINYAHSCGISVRLHTNGMLLDHALTEELLHSGVDLLSFSFDGYDSKGYEKVRIGGDYEKVLGNILRFLETKKKLNKKSPYTIIQVIENPSEPVDEKAKSQFISMFENLELDKLYIKRPHNWAGNISLDENHEVTQKPMIKSVCTFPWYALTILWDGTVVPCPQDWYSKMTLGSAAETPLFSIWNGNHMKRLRKQLIEKEPAPYSPCSQCDRLTRKTILGIPTENFKAFIGETIAGYNLVRKLIRR